MSKGQKDDRIQVVGSTEGWFDGKTLIPFDKLSDKRLQNVLIHAQRKQVTYHNKYCIFSELIERIEDEAEKRGLTLRDYDSEFHKNERMLREKIKNVNNETIFNEK